MANRVSNEQLEELLEFLAGHKTLAKGVGLGARSKETCDKLWNDLALRLNSFGSGSTKTGERWKKYWYDLKFKSKNRLAERRRDALATGGGPSNQEELSELDKKVLAILGEQAIYGDIEHRVPVFNNQPEVSVSAPVPMPLADIVVSEVIISDTAGLPVPVDSQPRIDSPEAPEIPEIAQQVPDHQSINQTGVEDPASQPVRRLPVCPRRQNRPSLTNRSQTRIDPEWVMELERSRVQAENKMADAALIIAEAAKNIAEASLLNAETSRRQLEVLNTMVEVVRQLSSGPAARPN